MKKFIFLLSTTMVIYATNGDLMIGHGPKSSGMAGIGIATSHGAESALSNPAMINSVKNSEFTVSATVFTPTVKFSSNAQANAMPSAKGGAYPHKAKLSYGSSKTDSPVVPDFSYAKRIGQNAVIGLTVDGTAGLGVDYKGQRKSGAFDMHTALKIMKVGVPVSYKVPRTELILGIEPVMQYSTLNTNYQTARGASNNKEAQNIGYGVQLGVAYEKRNVTVAATYQSKIRAKYKGNISHAMRDFGVKGVKSGDRLDQPAEAGVGISYKYKNSRLAVDYKKIAWSKAKGYKDFGWKDQDVIAVGYNYDAEKFSLRAGYNYAKSPLREKNGQAQGAQGYENSAINFFNLSGFPATIEEHYTVGADYELNDDVDLSFAYIYSPQVTKTFDTTGMTKGMVMQGAMANGATQAEAQMAAKNASDSVAKVEHAQSALVVGVNYKFGKSKR